MKKQEASYTVELALLMPLIVVVLILPIYMGYDMYSRAKQRPAGGWDESFCAEENVWNRKFAEKVVEEWK